MKPETLKALWESIEHHHENWRDPNNADISGEACALCARFGDDCFLPASDSEDIGEQCPVARRIGFTGCAFTPWVPLKHSFLSLPDSFNAFRVAEEAEIAFLVDLLPEVEE